jgi:ribose transport system substrate-binding protein
MLQGNPGMNVIFADTGPGVVGALLAIKQLKLEDKVQLYGFCADKTKIEKPYMGCVGQAPNQYGQLTIEEIKKYISGTDVEKEVLVATPTFNVGDEVPADIIG